MNSSVKIVTRVTKHSPNMTSQGNTRTWNVHTANQRRRPNWSRRLDSLSPIQKAQIAGTTPALATTIGSSTVPQK